MIRSLLIILILCASFINPCFAKERRLITVNQYINHIALDAAYDGIIKSLTDRKILPSKIDIINSNAQGNIANSVQIAKHHASLSPDFMVAIATPSAQTNLKAKGNNSVLAFVAVTDPKSANLIGHKNVIGVSDNPPIKELTIILKEVFPELKNVGIIFNPGEINSVKMSNEFEQEMKSYNINIKRAPISNSNDIKSAMNKLIPSVDLIYLPQDNSVISGLDNIVAISRANRIPLVANDPTLVNHGVLLALGSNYFASGVQLGNMIADMLNDIKLTNNIQDSATRELKINSEIAQELKIKIPANLGEKK